MFCLVLMGEILPHYTEAACRARCAELGIADRVEITGVLRGEDKAAQFRAAHLFVFPSVAPYESFGLALAEAMMWGLPIVATDWRGNRDVAEQVAIFAPVEGDLARNLAVSLAESLNQIICNSARAQDSRARFEKMFRLAADQSDYRNEVDRMLCLNPALRG